MSAKLFRNPPDLASLHHKPESRKHGRSRRRARPSSANSTEDIRLTTKGEVECADQAAASNASHVEADQHLIARFSRRDLIRGVVTGTLATGVPTLLPETLGPRSAAAIPLTSEAAPVGHPAPGTSNLGVAAVRDPALYR